MKFSIYQLEDPRDQQPRYIGVTGNMTQRLRAHLAGDSSNLAKNTWIEELQRAGLRPLMKELDTIEGSLSDAMERESLWIQRLQREGMPLLNGNQRKRGPDAFEQTHTRFTFWLDAEIKAQFEALADDQGAAKSTLLDEAIADLLEKYKKASTST